MSSFNFPEASQNSKEENPRRLTEIQMKVDKIMPRNEKNERTKSFTIDFAKIKEENESFRSTTPQPIPLLSAFCTMEKKNEFQNSSRKFRKKIPEESIFSKKSSCFSFFFPKNLKEIFSVRPLSELRSNYSNINNYHREKETFLENNINIKVNITVNSGSASARTKDNKKIVNNSKIIDQKIKHNSINTLPMTIKKVAVCENHEKNVKKTMIHGDNQILKKDGEILKNKKNISSKNNKTNGKCNVVLHKNNFQPHLIKNSENNEKAKKETKDEGF